LRLVLELDGDPARGPAHRGCELNPVGELTPAIRQPWHAPRHVGKFKTFREVEDIGDKQR
jgi:hypothetical protein